MIRWNLENCPRIDYCWTLLIAEIIPAVDFTIYFRANIDPTYDDLWILTTVTMRNVPWFSVDQLLSFCSTVNRSSSVKSIVSQLLAVCRRAQHILRLTSLFLYVGCGASWSLLGFSIKYSFAIRWTNYAANAILVPRAIYRIDTL